jgi:hypothetical protein
MQNLILNPPIFPLLLKQANSIVGDLIDSCLNIDKMPSTQRSNLSILIRVMLSQSFWGGAFIDVEGKDLKYIDCLESVHDANLEDYWEHHRTDNIPMIARPLNNQLCSKVAYYNQSLNNDLSSFRDLIKDYIKPNINILDILNNIKALCEILIIDGYLITKDFCSSELSSKILQGNKEDTKLSDGHVFVPKTTLISERTYYILTAGVVLSSIGIYIWSRKNKSI